MRTIVIFCLLVAITVTVGSSYAMKQATSGPFTVTADVPSIDVGSVTNESSAKGEPNIAYNFDIGFGTILVATYWNDLSFDPVEYMKGVKFPDTGIKQEDIQVKAFAIDGRQGAISQVYSPQENANLYDAIYLLDKNTKVIISCTGAGDLFDKAVKSIRVQKNIALVPSQPSAPSSLFGSQPEEITNASNSPPLSNETSRPEIKPENNRQPAISVNGTPLAISYKGSHMIRGYKAGLYQAKLESGGSVLIVASEGEIFSTTDNALITQAKQLIPENTVDLQTKLFKIDRKNGAIAMAQNTSDENDYHFAAVYMPDNKTLCTITTRDGREFDKTIKNIHFEWSGSDEPTGQSGLTQSQSSLLTDNSKRIQKATTSESLL